MKKTIEAKPTNKESGASAAQGEQIVQEPKGILGRIGHKINTIINERNSKKHERKILATVEEIKRLSQSKNGRDERRLLSIQHGYDSIVFLDGALLAMQTLLPYYYAQSYY